MDIQSKYKTQITIGYLKGLYFHTVLKEDPFYQITLLYYVIIVIVYKKGGKITH